MASGTIKKGIQSTALTLVESASQTGAYAYYSIVDHTVTLFLCITKPNTSWDIVGNLPPCYGDASIVSLGMLNSTHQIFLATSGGYSRIQIRTGTFTDTFYFSGSYLTSW